MERSKFNVDKDKEKRTYNNIVFDSQLEMKFFISLIRPIFMSYRKNMSCNRSTLTMARRSCQSFMLLIFIWNMPMGTLK